MPLGKETSQWHPGLEPIFIISDMTSRMNLLLLVLICRMSHESAGYRNRLSCEQSPYLLQHATNPVDWFVSISLKHTTDENFNITSIFMC